jgi:hypothetical protein
MRVLSGAFLATLALAWPDLPLGARVPDLLFIPLAGVVLLTRRPSLPVQGRWLDALVLAYLAGGVPSLFSTADLQGSVIEWLRGLYLAAIYLVVAVLVTRGHTRWASGSLTAGVLALATIGLVAAALALAFAIDVPRIAETMAIPYAGDVLRLRALTASPAMLACALTVAMPLAWAAGRRSVVPAASGDAPGAPAVSREPRATASMRGPGDNGVLGVAAMAVGSAALVLTFSHAAVGVLAAMAFVAWPALARQAGTWVRMGVATLVVMAALVANLGLVAAVRSISVGEVAAAEAVGSYHGVERDTLHVGRLRVDYDVVSYFRLKQEALSAFISRPWTGVGLDRFHEVTAVAYEQGRLPSHYRAADPHSSLFGRLAETGVAGAATLVALWIGFLMAGRQVVSRATLHPWIARAATAAVIGLAVNAVNVDVMNFRFLWAAFGLLRGLTHETTT